MEFKCVDYDNGKYEVSDGNEVFGSGSVSAVITWDSGTTAIILRITGVGGGTVYVYPEDLESMSSKVAYAMALQNMIEDIEGEYNRIYKELTNCIADSPEFLILRKMGIIVNKKDGE